MLRIEDTDRERFQESSARAILAAFSWLSIPPDEGPGIGGSMGPYVQSERLAIYKKYAQDLVDAGHAYYCFCTKERLTKMREEQEAAKLSLKYDRFCLCQLDEAERAQKGLRWRSVCHSHEDAG